MTSKADLTSAVRKFAYIVFALVLVGGMASPAKADLVHELDIFLDGPLSGTDAETAFVNLQLGGTSLTFLSKFEPGCTTGNCALDIDVDIDGSSAEISWDLTGTGITLGAVLLKDGNVQGLGHLYTLYSVTADQAVTSNGIQIAELPEDRGISHISFFSGGVPNVPEPMTLVLLGLGMLGTVLVGRRIK
jgi:hypothetical protein